MNTARHGPESIVAVRELRKAFGGIHAVDGATFSVSRGTITGLIGPNGAGKSTTVNLISGFLKPSSGKVTFESSDISGLPAHRVAQRGLTRTFQLSRDWPRLTVLEHLLVAAPDVRGSTLTGALLGKRSWRRSEAKAVDAARELLHKFDMQEMENAYARELSGGQKRLLEIMRGVMAKPSMLLLDEPFAGVNPTLGRRIESLLAGLRDEGLTMILIEHELGVVERLCNPIVVMALGRVLAEGTMRDLRANPEVVNAYLAG